MSSDASGAAGGAALHVADVVVDLGGQRVLDGIDVAVEPGRVLAVLGPSGGGKSTLLRTIVGLERPVRGTVHLDGVDQRGVHAHRRGVGLVFQDHQLFPHRDVGANVGFGLRMAGVARGERHERVAAVLDQVGLPGTERRAVTELSGGEAQRVALARALAPRPRLLLLDEPFGSVDRVLHDRLVADLRALVVSTGVTVVHVTHDRHEALALADDLAVLAAGAILQRGTVGEVWGAPADQLTAGLLGIDTVVRGEVLGGVLRVDGVVVAVGATLADGEAPVAVRPEAVDVRLEPPPVGEAWLGAVVERSSFGGASSEVTVRLPGVPALGALRCRASGPPPSVGSVAWVRLRPEGLVALPGGAPGA